MRVPYLGLAALLLRVGANGCAAQAQPATPVPGHSIEYVLPAPTTAKIVQLLGKRSPTYVGLYHQSQDTVLLAFSFEPWPRIIPEFRTLLHLGNRFLKINTARYVVLLDHDLTLYPKKRYIHAVDPLNALDVVVDMRGDFVRYTDWSRGKTGKK